MNLDFIEATVV